MPAYISIFKRQHVVTKKELCTILGLDTERPNLKFTNEEIYHAFRQRILLVHPDKQIGKDYPLDDASCTELKEEIEKARDLLIDGTGNAENTYQATPDFSDLIINFMNMRTRNQVNHAMSDLALRLIDHLMQDPAHFSENLKTVLQYMQVLPTSYAGAQLANGHLLLRMLTGLMPESRISLAHILNDQNIVALRQFLLTLHNNKPSQGEPAEAAIKEAALNLFGETFYQKLLENDRLAFIRRYALTIHHQFNEQHFNQSVKTWHEYYKTAPTWRQLIKTYLAGTFLRSDAVPSIYYFNRDWFAVVKQHKGWLGVMAASPLTFVSLAVAPAKLYMKAWDQAFDHVALPLLGRVIGNGLELAFSPLVLAARLAFPGLRKKTGVTGAFKKFGKTVASSVWNLTGGLVAKTAVDVLDTVSYLFTEKKPFVGWYSQVAEKVESGWQRFKGLFKHKPAPQPEAQEMTERTPLLNRPRVENDPWLEDVYSRVYGDQYQPEPALQQTTYGAVGSRLLIEPAPAEARRSSSPIPIPARQDELDEGIAASPPRESYLDCPDSGSEFEELPARRLG